jgi:hypothetical protein
MLQRIYTTGRIPMNSVIFSSCTPKLTDAELDSRGKGDTALSRSVFCNSNQRTDNSVCPMGVSAGDVLMRQRPDQRTFGSIGKMSSLGCTKADTCYAFSSASSFVARMDVHLDEIYDRFGDDAHQITMSGFAALPPNQFACVINAIRIVLHAAINPVFLGICETTTSTESIGKSDPALTSIVNGCVTVVCDEKIRPGQYVCLDYPFENLNIEIFKQIKKNATGDAFADDAQLDIIRDAIKLYTKAERCKSGPSKMRIVSMDEKNAYRKFTIPIGQCVRGSTAKGDLIQLRLFTNVY